MKRPVDLKALAGAVLQRNSARNNRATTAENSAQQTRVNRPGFVARDIAELDRLIEEVGRHHGFTEQDLREAREIALSNVGEALACFRALADECTAASPRS